MARTRRPGRRRERKTVLIVGEGRETEPNYFHGLKREDRVREAYAVTVKRGKGGSRVQIVRDVIDRMNEPGKDYDETWCVMDVERLDSEEARKGFVDAVELAKDNDIHLCLSNPAFEVWLRAHFIRSSRHFNDADAVIVDLNKRWCKRFNGAEYSKSDEGIHEKLAPLTEEAIGNARDVREKDHAGKGGTENCNSSTEVYRLVETLRGKPRR